MKSGVMKNGERKSLTPDSRLWTLDSRLPARSHGGNVYAFARARGIAPARVLDFSASINPLDWPPGTARAYSRALSQIVHYPEPYAETLTAALAEYHGLDPAAVLVGNGSTQLAYLLARTLAARRVLLVAPLFSEYETAFRLHNARTEYFFLRLPHFTLALERVEKALTNGYEALVLTNPNSPTGALVPRAQMEALISMCRRARTILVVDETFVDWVEEASITRLAPYKPHVVVLRSLTKFFAVPGLRVGYLLARPRLVERLRAGLEPWSVNTVAQEVARACLRDRRFVQRSKAFMAQERTWLATRLAALPGLRPFPSQANFLLVQITAGARDAPRLVQTLAENNLLVRACDDFPGLGKRFFRVAVRTRSENRRLLTALRAVLA